MVAAAALLAAGAALSAAGTVTGRVTLGGIRPAGDAVWVTGGRGCPEFIKDDRVSAREDGSLGDAVIELFAGRGVRAGTGGAPAVPGEAEIRAHACRIEPRVQVVRPGGLLAVTTLGGAHLFHAYRDGNTLWEELRDGRRVRAVGAVGPLDVRCDAGHEWELAWVYVTDAAHATVSDAAGRFRLEGVAAGEWTLRAWHAYLGTLVVPIEVDPERPSQLVVAFTGRGRIDALYPDGWVELR